MNAPRIEEAVARGFSRRAFLSKAATTIFGAAAAIAVQGLGMTSASANACAATTSSCSCSPPGPYCTAWKASYCSGANCAGACNYDYTYYPTTACWCTASCCGNCGTPSSFCRHYKCCDCTCPPGSCGCRNAIYDCQSLAAVSGGGVAPDAGLCC